MDTPQELIPKDGDRIVCFKVGKVKRASLYEMTRKYWPMNLEKASRATHALAIIDGVVESVFIPESGIILRFQVKNTNWNSRVKRIFLQTYL